MKYKDQNTWKGQWRFITFENLKDIPPTLFEFLRALPKSMDPRTVEQAILHRYGLHATVHARNNVITFAGREAVNKALAGQITSIDEIKINYEELGTGTTPPAAGDTGLETPGASTRQPISSVAASGNKLNINSFWAAGNATGTWKEYACFINGTATSNSGVIFVHVGIDITVGSADSLVIDGTITQIN